MEPKQIITYFIQGFYWYDTVFDENLTRCQFMLLVLLTLYSTNMTDTNTQEFSENEPTQQSSYTAHEQLEDMSPSLVTILEF